MRLLSLLPVVMTALTVARTGFDANFYTSAGYTIARMNTEAARDADYALAWGAWDHKIYVARGMARADMGDIEGAILDFEVFADATPGYWASQLMLGSELLKDDPWAALSHLQAAKALKRCPETATNLGVCYAKLRIWGCAAREFRDALEMAPGDPTATRNLGLFRAGK